MPTKWRAFLCNATNFQLFEKSFEKTYKNRRFKSHPLRDIFSRVPWQLNDRPKVIRLCDDMSEATLRWNSGAGTISGETAKRGFWYVVNEIILPTKQNALQTNKSWTINPKSYSKKECDSYSENEKKKKIRIEPVPERTKQNLLQRALQKMCQKLQAKFQSCGYILQLCIKKERER